jgi:RimJ/RimL family protein N-acetyltransferase
LKLRNFTIQDANRVASLVGDKSVSKWTSNIPFPYTERDAIDWINDSAGDSDRHPFAVEVDGEIVACVSYWPYGENAVEVGYWVGKNYWGQGICSEALSSLMSQDFFPECSDVYGQVMASNIGSQRVLQKCGFTLFGKCTINRSGEKIEGKLFVHRAVEEKGTA